MYWNLLQPLIAGEGMFTHRAMWSKIFRPDCPRKYSAFPSGCAKNSCVFFAVIFGTLWPHFNEGNPCCGCHIIFDRVNNWPDHSLGTVSLRMGGEKRCRSAQNWTWIWCGIRIHATLKNRCVHIHLGGVQPNITILGWGLSTCFSWPIPLHPLCFWTKFVPLNQALYGTFFLYFVFTIKIEGSI